MMSSSSNSMINNVLVTFAVLFANGALATEAPFSAPSSSSERILGSDFFAAIETMSSFDREDAIVEAVTAGQVPERLRKLSKVEFTQKDSQGISHNITIFVTNDYLAVGTEADHRRVPLSPLAAQKVADSLGMVLPTKLLVDRIYSASTDKVAPKPLKWGPQMASFRYFDRHEQIVQKQLENSALYSLRAGHKKDVILSPRLLKKPGQVAIYGWHRMNGRRIQPVCLIHDNNYADYSHGVRLISKTVLVDGQQMDLEELMANPSLHSLVSHDGPVAVNTYRRVLVGMN